MESKDRLVAGGRHGAAIVPGKGAQSNLIRYLTGDLKPRMPPDGAIDLERIGTIRRWIDEGAKVDGMIAPAAARPLPRAASGINTPHPVATPAPVTSLAYSPDGATLAAGGYRAVRLLDASTGALKKTLPGASGQVQSVAWSSDGRFLAAAGGVPGVSGEVLIFDVAAGKVTQSLAGHTEVVYAVCWKPHSQELATGSLDKTIRIWNASDGKSARTIKDHADAVFGLAYSPDGKLLASGSADRTAKIFETESWKRLETLSAHSDTVTHVAFSANGTLLATAGADRQLKVWKVDIGKMDNPLRSLGEGDTINTCAFSGDGSSLAWGASNDVVKVFNGDGANQRREMKDPRDWVYSLAIGADSKTLAAGTQDGKVFFWDLGSGRLIRSESLLPVGVKVDNAQ